MLLCLTLVAGPIVSPVHAGSYGYLREDNPFVEAMLRMMEVFGFIDRDRLPLGVPYLPSPGFNNPAFSSPMLAGTFAANPMASGLPGLGGGPLTGLGGLPAPGGMAGAYPLAGGMPMPGTFATPVPGAFPGIAGFPGSGYPPGLTAAPWQDAPGNRGSRQPGLLDGIWETGKGAVVIIRGDAARLYVSRDTYQDFVIRYDHDHFWWQPRDGSKFRRYRYEMREGRMVLADKNNNLLLLRRRR